MIFRAFQIQYRRRYLFWEYFIVSIVWLTASFTLFSCLITSKKVICINTIAHVHLSHRRWHVRAPLHMASASYRARCRCRNQSDQPREPWRGLCVCKEPNTRYIVQWSPKTLSQIHHLSVYSGYAQCACLDQCKCNKRHRRSVYLISCTAY